MTAQQTHPSTKKETAFWRRLIEAACSTVANEPEWLVEAVLVVQQFDRLTDAERDELLSVADRVAEEQGVMALPEPDGESLAIWFGRPERKGDAGAVVRLAYVRPVEREALLRREQHMNDIIYIAISLGLFVVFAAAIYGYERVE